MLSKESPSQKDILGTAKNVSRRTATKTLTVGFLSLLTGAQRSLANVVTDSAYLFVHPELRKFVPAIVRMANQYKLTPEFIAAVRGSSSQQNPPSLGDIPVQEKWIPGLDDGPDVRVYVVNAKPDASRPAILHIHGGGFILGSAVTSVRDAQSWAKELDCTVVTVDYRLAPEHKYTDSVNDNYAALQWLYRHAEELGVNPDQIVLMGESAGGGHAALLALKARDLGEIPILFQCLIYPMLDDRTGITRPVAHNVGTIGWTIESNIFGWQAFLGEEPGTDKVPAEAVPARVKDLSGLPPTFIGVGGIDLFVDENIEYAQRLIDAGVPTQLLVQPGAFHGFDTHGAKTSIGKQFNEAKMDALRRAFNGQFN